jgi:hypothetical protein
MKIIRWIPAGLLALAGSAHAKDIDPFYIGASVGFVDYQLNTTSAERQLPFRNSAGQLLSTDHYRFDTSSNAFQLFGGYRFTRYVAAELAYADLGNVRRAGDFTVSAPGPMQGGVITSRTQFGPHGVSLSALGFWPINDQIELFGRLGAYRWRASAPYTLKFEGDLVDRGNPRDSGTGPLLGIGATYQWEGFGVRVEYQRYSFDRPFNAVHDTEANVIDVGFFTHF